LMSNMMSNTILLDQTIQWSNDPPSFFDAMGPMYLSSQAARLSWLLYQAEHAQQNTHNMSGEEFLNDGEVYECTEVRVPFVCIPGNRELTGTSYTSPIRLKQMFV